MWGNAIFEQSDDTGRVLSWASDLPGWSHSEVDLIEEDSIGARCQEQHIRNILFVPEPIAYLVKMN